MIASRTAHTKTAARETQDHIIVKVLRKRLYWEVDVAEPTARADAQHTVGCSQVVVTTEAVRGTLHIGLHGGVGQYVSADLCSG